MGNQEHRPHVEAGLKETQKEKVQSRHVSINPESSSFYPRGTEYTEFSGDGKIFYVNDVAIPEAIDKLERGRSRGRDIDLDLNNITPDKKLVWWTCRVCTEEKEKPFEQKMFEHEDTNDDGEVQIVGVTDEKSLRLPDDEKLRSKVYLDNKIPAAVQDAIEKSIQKARESRQ